MGAGFKIDSRVNEFDKYSSVRSGKRECRQRRSCVQAHGRRHGFRVSARLWFSSGPKGLYQAAAARRGLSDDGLQARATNTQSPYDAWRKEEALAVSGQTRIHRESFPRRCVVLYADFSIAQPLHRPRCICRHLSFPRVEFRRGFERAIVIASGSQLSSFAFYQLR